MSDFRIERYNVYPGMYSSAWFIFFRYNHEHDDREQSVQWFNGIFSVALVDLFGLLTYYCSKYVGTGIMIVHYASRELFTITSSDSGVCVLFTLNRCSYPITSYNTQRPF